MRLKKGREITFTAIDDFTGEMLKLKGTILDEGYHYVQNHKYLQEEYGGIVEGEAYIVKENSHSGNIHLVLVENVLEIF